MTKDDIINTAIEFVGNCNIIKGCIIEENDDYIELIILNNFKTKRLRIDEYTLSQYICMFVSDSFVLKN